jgi:NADH-quinone oxidoreductase subunit H
MSAMMPVLKIVAVAVGSLVFFLVNIIVVLYLERKVMAHTQLRLGPMRTGFHGLLQPIADAIKLLTKEDIIPDRADRMLFVAAPVIAFAPSFLLYLGMPWVGEWIGIDLEVNLFLIFAVAAITTIGVLVGGWASYSKYPLYGTFRAAAQQISYEVPLLLSIAGIIMLSESLRITSIVEAQSGLWHAAVQPLAFVLFIILMHAELNRTPFDMPEAESELVAGYSAEYSSIRFAVFFLAEYGNTFTFSLLGAMLFLGGWSGPVLPGFVWLMAKTYLIVFIALWSRATLPRVRVDQLMSFAWKVMLPFSLASVAVTAVGIALDSMLALFAFQAFGLLAFAFAVREASLSGIRNPGHIASSRPNKTPATTPAPEPGTEVT